MRRTPRFCELGRLGWAFEFRASCMEIYNEELRDLLPGGSAKLKISDAHNVVSVPDLKSAAVEDAESLSSSTSTKSHNESARV